MKGLVGVAGLKMSPGRIAPLSNSGSLTKDPFTGPLLPLLPPLLHLLHPPLPSHPGPGPFRAS